MEFMDLIKSRRSVRAYDGRPVEREKLEALAEAVRLAPSASNGQPWRLILVDEPGLREKVAGASFDGVVGFNRFAIAAPALAVLVVEPPRAITRVGALIKRREFPLIDIGIAASQLCLLATELGLGTCMLGWFDEGRIKRLLGVPSGKRIGLLVTIGYPAADQAPREKARKSLDEVRTYNRYR